ncbi:TonB-dependent receptor [Oscillatoria amoena NRMC-F 0135]|nr:TonB-dependent receptor [Oscillatoria amoena NRMC-F 0135]
MSKVVITILLAILLAIGHAYSQKLMGLVVEKNPQGVDEPLTGANVYWLGTTTGVTTGSNGIFMIDRVEGLQKLVVSYVGYKPDTIIVTNQTSVKVYLVSDQVLDEITVKGWKPTTGLDQARNINTVIMSEKELFKAACCNLSESFETNPSVDVAFTDAVTGTRQIQMLGLAGPNTLISIENMPGVRGLASSQGIQFIPGTWINSIQVTKGVGSVVNGYESIAGQINVELKKPEESEKVFLNGYINQSARSELNLNYTAHTGSKWATAFLLHGSTRPLEMDNNNDTFLDFPTGSQINFINRWVYNNGKGLLGQIGVKALQDWKLGGQEGYHAEHDKFTTNRYGFEIDTKRYELWGKLGYQFPSKPYMSVGLQVSATRHEHDSYYGFTTHQADQNSFYSNLIYQSIISNTSHKVKAGISFMYDEVKEDLTNPTSGIDYDGSVTPMINFSRSEIIPGIFAEYNYDDLQKFSLIAGVRVDHHNLFGTFFTPRLHLRYNLTDLTTIRASAGKGIRVSNILAENTGIMVSSRQFVFTGLQSANAYGFKPDVAWNYGINLSQDFTIDYRSGSLTVDYFYTDFQNQVVLDYDFSTRQARFFGLTGKSFSHSLQVQVDYELIRRFDLRLAYRMLDVQTDYTETRLTRPLISRHRAFVNLAYETKSKWKFDYTVQWLDRQRIPDTSENIPEYQLSDWSSAYFLMSAQITKDLKERWSFYVGVENLNNFVLSNPIIAADQPFSQYFDSSLVWGPVFGRMAYAGFRYRVK